MASNFDEMIDRRNTASLKWDVEENELPMWVADMNFPTVPTVPQAIIERAQHPVYGYFSPTDDYYNSIIDWQSTRNGVTGLTSEAIGYENGVLGGVISTLTAFAAPGDSALCVDLP